jgi:hypothetical protein
VSSAAGTSGRQVCASSSQSPAPAQVSAGAQSASAVQPNVHMSQPSSGSTLPSSQSSPTSTYMSPQVTSAHAPDLQTLPVPHSMPSGAGVPGTQTCASEQSSWPVHGSPSSQRPSMPGRQVYEQSSSQPSPATWLPSSQIS